MEDQRQIVTFGGGGFSMEPGNRLLDEFVLDLTGKARPRVCFLPHASGDADHYIVRFYRAFSGERAEASHLSLFRRERCPAEPREHLLSQDLIYVGGGSVASLLGVWKAHGIDEILREAWERGILICGLSAGSLCWFEEGVSNFHGPIERIRGLGFLPYSNTVHYSSEPTRREAYHRWLVEGMPPGYAVDDGAALHWTGTEVAQVVASRPQARAYRLDCMKGKVRTTRLATRFLGDPLATPLLPPLVTEGEASASLPAAELPGRLSAA
ncbi:peptidase E [Thermoleophilia bacterium SCSIO 60948]|nr:peptidase E [Thermoleophilia bacterium SCSIO 60948]